MWHLLQVEAYLRLISGNKVLYFFLRTIAYFGHGDIISMSSNVIFSLLYNIIVIILLLFARLLSLFL